MNAESLIVTPKPYPVHIIDGVERHFARLAARPDFGGLMKFRQAEATLPRSVWVEEDLRGLGLPVWNQGNHGSCVGHGSLMAYLIAYLQLGGTVPPGGFSPTSLYALINGGRDAGAIVSDAMEALINQGVALMSQYPESVIFDRQLSAAARAEVNATRQRFRLAEAYHVQTFDEIATAVQLGYAVSFGITIRSGFNNPGRDGLIEAGGFPLGGHCMAVVGLRKVGGRWVLIVRNSWGESFAVGGDCLLPEEHFRGGNLDAFACKAAAPDPQDPNQAPIAP